MNSQRVKVLHVANGDAVVEPIANDFVFNLFPAAKGFLDQNLVGKRQRVSSVQTQFLFVVTESAALPAQRVRSADNYRIPDFFRRLDRVFDILDRLGFNRMDADLRQLFHEQIPVFGIDNRFNRRSQNPNPVLIQRPVFVQRHAAVESRLTAEGKQNPVRPFLLNYLLDVFRRNRQKINRISYALRSLYGRNVRIDKNSVNALFSQRLESLRARVVKLSSLANLQSSGTKKKDFGKTISCERSRARCIITAPVGRFEFFVHLYLLLSIAYCLLPTAF